MIVLLCMLAGLLRSSGAEMCRKRTRAIVRRCTVYTARQPGGRILLG